MDTICNRIRNLRRSRGLSHEQLGYEIDVSRQTVSKWELNEIKPTTENILALCRYFGVPFEYFFDNEDTPPRRNYHLLTTMQQKHRRLL